jgi:uroporphyrinogen-III decarboxylase
MTSRERICAAIRKEDVDYVPCYASFNPLDKTLRRGHQWNFPWPLEAATQEQLQYQVKQLGLDQVVRVEANLCRPVSGVESRVWINDGILHKSYQTPAGELHASIRYDNLWPHGWDIPFYSDFNIGHYVEPWIQNEADLECFTNIVRLCDTREVLEKVREEAKHARQIADEYSLATLARFGRGLTGALLVFGASQLCIMTIENPDLVHAYMEHDHQINLRAIEVLGECGVDIWHRNGFYETADFYSPDMLEQFVAPRVCREAEAARAKGMLSSYLLHTGLAPILNYVESLTVDSIFGIDVAFKDLKLDAVKRTLCENKCLWIGPSSTYHLWKGPEATREAVRNVFSVFDKTGLIISPCVSTHSIMPWESTLAMIDEWKKLRDS